MLTSSLAWPAVVFGAAALVSVGAGNIGAGVIAGLALLLVVGRRFTAALVFRIPDAGAAWPPREVLLALGAVWLTHALATALADPGPVRWAKLVEEMWLKALLVTVPLLLAGRPRLIRAAALATVATGAVVSLYALAQFLGDHDYWRDKPLLHTAGFPIATAFHGHHLSWGGQAMLVLTVAMVWLRETLLERPRRLWLPLVACLVLGTGLIVSFARSAQLGTLAAAVFLVVTLPGLWRRFGVAALLVAIVIALSIPAVRLRAVEAFTDEKEVTRPNLWRSSLAGIADRPLLGWGPGNYRVMLDAHEVDGFYESRAHAHNDYLMHAVNAGLLGLAASMWLLVATVRHLGDGWRRGGPGSWICLAALAAQVAVSVSGVFQVYQTDDEPEMVLYYLVGLGLARLMTRRETPPA